MQTVSITSVEWPMQTCAQSPLPAPAPARSPPPPPPPTQGTHYCSNDVSDCVLYVQVATLYNLCKALQSFHVRGMVHCSLAPLTFSWFQGGQGWKVAACGDWAQAGMHVRSCYQLRYASPEVTQMLPATGITACSDCVVHRQGYMCGTISPQLCFVTGGLRCVC